jgi:hypothetical protein
MSHNTASSLRIAPVVWITASWSAILAILFFVAAAGQPKFEYSTYQATRRAIALIIPALAVATLLLAAYRVTRDQAPPWWTSPTLVSLALFWALFPPSWFFIEYLALDGGAINLPKDKDLLLNEFKLSASTSESVKEAVLKHARTYADLAAKFWAAVGAALALIVGFGGKR